MIKQANNFSPRKIVGLTAWLMLRRRALAGIAAILMGASFIFSGNVSAHNISLKKARDVARTYARQVRDESGGRYLHYSTNCVAAFPNHNHIARCEISYTNAEDEKKGVYTCRELIEIKMMAHDTGWGYTLFGYNVQGVCGSRRLNGQIMSY